MLSIHLERLGTEKQDLGQHVDLQFRLYTMCLQLGHVNRNQVGSGRGDRIEGMNEDEIARIEEHLRNICRGSMET